MCILQDFSKAMTSSGMLGKYSESSPDTLLSKLVEIQSAASRIQDQRRAMTALDERRQKLRESEALLWKSKIQGTNTWVCLGSSLFLEFPTTTAAKFLADDRKTVERTITETEKSLKTSLDELLKLEGSKDLRDRGFDLTPIQEDRSD